MNLTLTVPDDWLRDVHSQYELLKREDATVRRMVVELLSSAAGALSSEPSVIEAAPVLAVFAKTTRVMAYIPDGVARTLAGLSRVRQTTPSETAKALLYTQWSRHPKNVRQATVGDSPLTQLLGKMTGREVRPEQIAAFS